MSNEKLRREEHEAFRERVAYHDFTHQMLKAEGPDAGVFMDKMFVNDISGKDVGQGVYTSMLNEEGEMIDDLIIFRMEENMYWLSTLYIDQMMEVFNKYSKDYEVNFTDIRDTTVMYAVQGPDSTKTLNKILDQSIDDLKFTRIMSNKIDNVDLKVANFGFTGETGYELYFHPDHIDFIEKKLEEAGKEFDIAHIETDVYLSSIPTEYGLKIMRDFEGLDPYEANLGWTVDWDSNFIGKEAIRDSKENGPKRTLLGFKVANDDAEVELESDILKGGEKVGHVTNYTYGYTVGKNIGFALVDKDKAKKGDKVRIDGVDGELTS
ncbi:MAG: aminomethyltransferase family protein, partial [Atopostipes suicloacalis]|nr:aminomethyltransferase family protein [Atopostipes suicloacalis]